MILTSSCIALQNSWSSLSKICAYLCHSSDMIDINRKKQLFMPKHWKYAAASSQIPCDLHKAASVFDWLVFYSRMAQMKVTPKDRWGKAWQVRTWVEVHTTPAEPSASTESVAPTTEESPQPKVRCSKGGGGEKTGVGEEVSTVIPNETVGWDTCQSRVINVSWEGASQEETPANCGGQGPQKGVSRGWTVEEALEVLTRDCSYPQDLPVLEEHWAPCTQASLLMSGLWNCPRSGKIWHALPGACSPDSAGGCRVLSGWPTERHQPMSG